VLRITWR